MITHYVLRITHSGSRITHYALRISVPRSAGSAQEGLMMSESMFSWKLDGEHSGSAAGRRWCRLCRSGRPPDYGGLLWGGWPGRGMRTPELRGAGAQPWAAVPHGLLGWRPPSGGHKPFGAQPWLCSRVRAGQKGDVPRQRLVRLPSRRDGLSPRKARPRLCGRGVLVSHERELWGGRDAPPTASRGSAPLR